jgi:hypothetical protein
MTMVFDPDASRYKEVMEAEERVNLNTLDKNLTNIMEQKGMSFLQLLDSVAVRLICAHFLE